MAVTSIILDKRFSVENKYHVTIRVSNYYKKNYLPTGYIIKESDWDSSKRKIKKQCKQYNADVANINITNMKQQFDNYLTERGLKENLAEYTPKQLILDFKEKLQEKKKPKEESINDCDFLKLMIDYSDLCKKRNSKASTASTFKTTHTLLLNYLKEERLKDINKNIARTVSFNIHLIDKDFLIDLKKYCQEKLNHSTATMGINFTNIRTVYNYAIKELKIISKNNYPFEGFKLPKETANKKEPLEIGEIGKLFKYEPQNYKEEVAIDIFKLLFMFLGLNIKDLLYLQKDYIFNNRLHFDRLKTQNELSIYIIPEAWDIIKKYEGEEFLLNFLEKKLKTAKQDRSTEVYTDIKGDVNETLKKIAKSLNIRKLSTAYARNSFATIANEVGIDVKHIQKCLGHVSNEVIDRYIYVRKEHIDNAQDEVLFYVNNFEAYHAFKQKEKDERRQRILDAL
ncbi:MAG: site-specific integrase [Bacteroidales bacterium]|jgi:site-specific recombinase XerD|nr:site-specific integrase [Bacteroidales bacterium]